MKCKILIEIPKTVDGKRMGPYAKGSVHDLDNDRAQLFIGSAMAEEVIDPPVVKKPAEAPAKAPESKPETDTKKESKVVKKKGE